MKVNQLYVYLFVLSFISCQNEEIKKTCDYEIIASDNLSNPFGCLGETRTVTISILKVTMVDGILGDKEAVSPKYIGIEVDENYFNVAKVQSLEDSLQFELKSNMNKESNIIVTDLKITVNDPSSAETKIKKLTLSINKGQLTYKYIIQSEKNPFMLSPDGGKYELPFTCAKQTYLDRNLLNEEYSPLKGLRYIGLNASNIKYVQVDKDGKKIGHYKFTFEGGPRYNQSSKPECTFSVYFADADIFGDLPEPLFQQDFIQPQTEGENYWVPSSHSSYETGLFDF